MDEGSAVSQDVGSAPTESTSTSSPATSAVDTSSAAASSQPAANPAQPQSRTYQQADVERIIQARLDQANKAFEKKLAALTQQNQAAARAFAQHAGVLPAEKPAPEFVNRDQFQKSIHSLREDLRREHQEAIFRAQVESDWGAVQKAHPDYATLPGFQDAFLKAWGSNPAGGAELAKDIVKHYDDLFAKRQQQYAQQKTEAAQVAVVPAGQGAATSPKANASLQDRIKSALASRS